MSTHTPVCELLGIEYPIVEAPLSADPHWSAEEARHATGCGVDIVVAQGWEAGGHVWGGVATLPLVRAVVDAVAPVPVIAAGGIGDARGVAAVLALDAQAAVPGTRFLLANEMPVHRNTGVA
ncbi:MAG TPA: nitronate monooxygenase [Solirubrobacteraceae bacterium]|jgi:NAD(P)H-dependent flavin oxidoreductase YrpB (nitropropane dioxygenase family)|nr:nitronate monooxygenase [Solirubrobacteraceae bacterium]